MLLLYYLSNFLKILDFLVLLKNHLNSSLVKLAEKTKPEIKESLEFAYEPH
jgi:hypothetical protein